MARRKKAKEENDVGQDFRSDEWIKNPHHPSCLCFDCGFCDSVYTKSQEPQLTELKILNDLAAQVAKAACDRNTNLKYFYQHLIKRGLKTLDFDKE